MHYIWKVNGITQSETSAKFTKLFLTADRNGKVECAATITNNNKTIETVGFIDYYGK